MSSEVPPRPAEFGESELAKPTELSRRRDLRGGRARDWMLIASQRQNDVHLFSAQTSLGGVLGGNLAFYTMITSRTCLEVPVQSIKWKRR